MTQTETAPAAEAETVPALAGVTPEGLAPQTLIGAYRNDKHQYWFNRQGPVPSVTTVLGVLDKPAVAIHKVKVATAAVNALGLIPWASDEELVSYALASADRVRDEAANLGSSVHLLADLVGGQEKAIEGFQASDMEIPYIRAYEAFLARYSRSAIVSSEHMVWSTEGYAGTYDLLMQIDGELWLIDIKTSGKGPYPEWALQLAGYGWADWIIIPGNPQPYQMPAVDRFGVLHLRPDLYLDTGWRLIEYPVTERDFRAFLSALDLYIWKGERRFTKRILLKP